MTLWIGNGAVLKSSSQWQLHEKFMTEYLMFKIILTAINWNFKELHH